MHQNYSTSNVQGRQVEATGEVVEEGGEPWEGEVE